MKIVTTYIEKGRRFYICKADGRGEADGYWAFEDKFVDDAGKLTKVFNGITGHHSKTLKETVEKVSNLIKVDALVESGMDRYEAAIKVVIGG